MSRSIRFKNNTFLDASSITWGRYKLSDYLPQFIRHRDCDKSTVTDLNQYLTTGIYQMSAVYTNSPITGTLYGVLIVITSRRYAYTPQDYSNWIWQIVLSGIAIYFRQKTNEQPWSKWYTIQKG